MLVAIRQASKRPRGGDICQKCSLGCDAYRPSVDLG